MSSPMTPVESTTNTPADTPLQVRRRRLLQVVWLAYAGAVGALTIAGLPTFYDALQHTCDDTGCLTFLQLSTTNARALQAAGLSLDAYAAYTLVTRGLIFPIATFGLAALLIWRKPDDRVARLFAFVLVAFGAQNAQGIATLAALNPVWGVVNQSIGFIQRAAFVPLFCLFPNGRWVPHWSKWVALAFVLVNLLSFFPALKPAGSVEAALVIMAYTFVPAVQIYRYRRVATWTQRQQTKWVVFSLALFAFPTLLLVPVAILWVPSLFELGTLPNLIINVYALWTILFVQVAFVIAILRHRLFDIDLVINRALVYGALTACVVAVYVAIVAGLGAAFQSQGNLLVSLLATGLIAVVFQPLRGRLQRAVNRLMYGERDEPYRVLTRLGQHLEAAIEPAAALPLTVETVARALKLPYVAIALKQGDVFQTVAAYGVSQNTLTRLPLTYTGETIGELVVATRAPGEPLTAADQRLLSDLARQIGVTTHAILLAADLDRARLRIVAAREETRRRLGSDLHDGVGHQLAGLARQAERAMHVLERDPTAARGLLAEVTQQLNAAIAQVRGLAHQLHPPELELLGLAGALRERAQTHTGLVVRIDAPDTLPPLPTAVETAAYFIALEVLTNVAKHANARSCHIRLALVNDASALGPPVLELNIADDGRGLPPDMRHGLGLLSMQARAADVGGVCRIESIPHGGTSVSVCLPCLAQLEE
jgi:signal transduction histidine kinase